MSSTSMMSVMTASPTTMNATTTSQAAAATTPICGWYNLGHGDGYAAIECATNQVCAYNTDVSILQCISTEFFLPGFTGSPLPSNTAIFQTACTENPSGTTSYADILTCRDHQCTTATATVNNATLSALQCNPAYFLGSSSSMPPYSVEFYYDFTTFAAPMVAAESDATIVYTMSASPLFSYAQYNPITATTTASGLGQSVTFSSVPTPVITLMPTTTHSGAAAKSFGLRYWICAAAVAGLALLA